MSGYRARSNSMASGFPSLSTYTHLPDNGIPLYVQQIQPRSMAAPQQYSGIPTATFMVAPPQQKGFYPPVVYAGNGHKAYPMYSEPVSYHPESGYRDAYSSQGRPRSHSSAQQMLIHPQAPMHVPFPGYESEARGRRESRSSKRGIFGSMVDSIRSRSKSKSKSRPQTPEPGYGREKSMDGRTTPYMMVDEFGRPLSENEVLRVLKTQRSQMEKDLLLLRNDDPYSRAHSRERTVSQGSATSSRKEAKYDDPTLASNTQLNSRTFINRGPPRSTPRASGYETEGPRPRSRTSAASVPSSGKLSRPTPLTLEPDPNARGWFNRRGDQYFDRKTIICPPKQNSYPKKFDLYPEVGEGYMDNLGRVIDCNGKFVRRMG